MIKNTRKMFLLAASRIHLFISECCCSTSQLKTHKKGREKKINEIRQTKINADELKSVKKKAGMTLGCARKPFRVCECAYSFQ